MMAVGLWAELSLGWTIKRKQRQEKNRTVFFFLSAPDAILFIAFG